MRVRLPASLAHEDGADLKTVPEAYSPAPIYSRDRTCFRNFSESHCPEQGRVGTSALLNIFTKASSRLASRLGRRPERRSRWIQVPPSTVTGRGGTPRSPPGRCLPA